MKRMTARRFGALTVMACVVSALAVASDMGEQRPKEKVSVDLRLATDGLTGGGDIMAGEIVYSKRNSVDLKEGPRRSDETVATLDKGAELTVVDTRGAQLQVRTKRGVEGWVSKLNTTSDKPRGSLGDVKILTSDDLGPGERSNVGAIRGLQEMAEDYAAEVEVPQEAIDDVKKMEAITLTINQQDIDEFLEEGDVQ